MKQTTIEIEFRIDKNGKKRAYRWSLRQQRYFPIAMAKAEEMIANGEAVEYRKNDAVDCTPAPVTPVTPAPFPLMLAYPKVA